MKVDCKSTSSPQLVNLSRNIGYQEDLMVLYNGEPIINNTGQLICNDGKTRDTAVTKVPLKDEQGNVYGLVGICRDITEEKKLLEEYYKEKQLLRTLIDNLPFSIFVKDDKARKLIANKLDIEFMGLKSEAEALGKTDFEIFGDIERNHGFEEDMEVIGEGKSVIDSDNLVIDKNGNISNWLVTKLPLKDENGTTYGLVGICRDVTEEKKLVEQLKLVDFAFRNSAVPMHFIREDGSILDCNKAACALLGYTQEEYLSKTIFDFNKNNTKEVFKEFWKNFSNNSDKPTYLSLTNKNNKLNVVEARANKIVYGKIELMCSSFIDITENLKIENQLKLVDFAFRESSIPIFFIEEDGTLLNINNAAIELYGYTEDEMRGMKVRMVSATQSDEIYQQHFYKIWRIIKEKGRHLIINKHKKKNGEILDIEINFNYIEFGGKKLNCAFLKDITEKREAEIEKEHLLSELIQSNMELKQFSYITTHNLRAPLTNLISICNIINTKTISDRVTLNLIDGFKSSTHQLNNTLNDLIDILIIKENINLPTGRVFFQNTLDKVKASLLNTLLKENVVIEAHFEEATSVCFSSIYLESVLLNLLTNSIKYHHPNRNPIIKIDTKKDGDGNTIMTFTDNGIGMDMKRVKDKIFGLYQRFHGNSNSKGIGLYLIHSQITALKGKIEVTSEVNVGTTFTVTFR